MAKDNTPSEYDVWIDETLCTGDGLCQEVCPEIFFGHDDGLFYVKDVTDPSGLDANGNPKNIGGTGLVRIPIRLMDDVIEAASECPGDCIFIEQRRK